MAEALLSIQAESIYDRHDILPIGALPIDSARQVMGLFQDKFTEDTPHQLDEAMGRFDQAMIEGMTNFYDCLEFAKPLSRAALSAAEIDQVPLAITSTMLPDRLVAVMAMGVQQRLGVEAHGFGYVTERQQRQKTPPPIGFDGSRVRNYATELGLPKLVSLGNWYDLIEGHSIAYDADHRIVDGLALTPRPEDASYCFYQQNGRRSGWVRMSSNGQEQVYLRSRRSNPPVKMIQDALKEERTR